MFSALTGSKFSVVSSFLGLKSRPHAGQNHTGTATGSVRPTTGSTISSASPVLSFSSHNAPAGPMGSFLCILHNSHSFTSSLIVSPPCLRTIP